MIETCDIMSYKILNSTSDREVEIPMPKRIKILNDFLNITPTLSEEAENNVNSIQAISEVLSVPKITKVNLSKVSLKVVSVPSGNGSKTVVKAVPKLFKNESISIDDVKNEAILKSYKSQAKSNFSTKTMVTDVVNPLKEQSKSPISTNTLVKDDVKSPADQSKSQPIMLAEDTRQFLIYLTNHKDQFLSLRNRTKAYFWKQMEKDLKRQGVMRRTAAQLDNKWQSLMISYKWFISDEIDQYKCPYIEEIKEILIDPLQSQNYTVSIGLNSTYQSVKNPSVKSIASTSSSCHTIGDENYHNLPGAVLSIGMLQDINEISRILEKEPTYNTTSIKNLKQIYLQKKIDGRELKCKLMQQLLQNPNDNNNTTNRFKVIKNE